MMTLPCPETMHLYASGKYQPPTRDDIMAVFGKCGMKEAQIAALVGVANTRTVRSWVASPAAKRHAQIPYAAWRLLLQEAGFVRHQKRRSQPRNKDEAA